MADVDDWKEIDDWQEIQPAKPDLMDRFATQYAIPALQGIGRGAVSAVGSAAQFMDKYGGGASLRAGIGRAMEGKPGEAFSAAYEQYGQDPTKAPSGKDLAARAGLSTQEFETPLIMNPFAQDGGKLKVSPAGVVGGIGEGLADPLNVLPVGKAAQGAAFLARKGVVAPVAKAGEIAAPILGKAAFRIPTETTRAFMQDPARIESAAKMYTAEDLKDIIDQTVGGAKKDVETITEKRDLAREALKQKLRDRRFDLQRRDPNTEVVFKVQEQMEGAKAKLRQMSEVADEYLAKSQMKFLKKDLIKAANQVLADMSDVKMGMGRRDALKKWQSYLEELKEQPGIINGPRMREIMRQVRSDKNWKLEAGEFNEDLDIMRTKFTERVSDELKKRSPEYKQIMDAAHERAKNLEFLSQQFGRKNDPTQGQRTLSGLQQGKNVTNDYLREQLKKHAAYMQDESLPKLLENWEQGNRTLERMQRGEDLSQELFPEDVSALKDLETAKLLAEENYAPMSRMRPGSDKAQSVIRRFNYPTASIEDRRALEAIGQRAGMDLPQIVKDKAIYEQFDKDATAGTRMTAMGAMLGGWPGAALGFMGDRFGGQVLREGIKSGVGLKRTMDNVLLKIQTDPSFRAKFEGPLLKAARGGARSMVVYHHLMMNNDPEYRAYFSEGAQ